MRDSAQLRRGILLPTSIALLCAITSSALAVLILQHFLLVAWGDDRPYPISLVALIKYLGSVGLTAAKTFKPAYWVVSPRLCLDRVLGAIGTALVSGDLALRFRLMLEFVGVIWLVAFTTSFITCWRLSPPCDRRQHISGRRMIAAGSQARRFFRRSERDAIKATGAGLSLCRGMTMSFQREARHIVLMGATGSGKTVIIRHLLRQIFARGDRVILSDTKGDFTSAMPGAFILLAPHDERSAIWDVAADVTSELDARELAASLIPVARDPLWANGAREIVTGVIVALQNMDGADWSWEDLRAVVFMPIPDLRGILQRHYPMAAGYLELDATGMPTKIAISFAITVHAHLAGVIIPLAKAWGVPGSRMKVSIRAFLSDEKGRNRVLILQRAPNYPELSSAWTRAFVTLASNFAVSPALPEDSHRRIWFCLDEFPQLGKVETFQQILEVGRSRGLCVILGIQDTHQLQHIYGADVARTWQSSIGTKIICRMEASASADLVRREIIGKRIVSWTGKTKTVAPWKWDGSGSGVTYSRQSQREEIDVISSASLETELGWRNAWPTPTIRALIVGVGRGQAQAVLRAEWTIEAWPVLRAPTKIASWTQ